MRICFHEITPEEYLPRWRASIERVAKQVIRLDTEFYVCFPKEDLGQWSKGVKIGSSKFNGNYLRCILQAEKDGFDAVILGCFLDPALSEAKDICSIPVVGPAESSILFAYLFANKYAIVTFPPQKSRCLIEKQIDLYGFRSKAITNPVRLLSYPESELWEIARGKNPNHLVQNFIRISKEAIKDGAEIIIQGCTAMHFIYPNVQKIKDTNVRVLNPIQAAIKVAEALVDFKKGLGFHKSK